MRRVATRRPEVLDAIVRLNIETGAPVSSGLVARFLRGSCSAATVRTIMRELEDDGLLVKPHASSGRLPTDRGYRAFVDRLLASWPLHRWELPRPLRREVEEGLQRTAGTQAMVKALASLLSRMTANISIILGPSWESVRAIRLDAYPKEGRRALLVLVLDNALVRTGQIVLAGDYPPGVLEQAARLLSERISGRTVGEIRAGVLRILDSGGSAAGRCAAELATRGRELFADLELGDVELEGVGKMLNEPEFSEPGPLKDLVRFLESPRTIREVLQRLSLQASGSLGVWIGSENPVDELRAFSLLSARFDIEGRHGILAVLGLRRMLYPRAFTGIDVLRQTLQSLN